MLRKRTFSDQGALIAPNFFCNRRLLRPVLQLDMYSCETCPLCCAAAPDELLQHECLFASKWQAGKVRCASG